MRLPYRLAVSSVLCCIFFHDVSAQGFLNPAGAPAPSMRTLQQIEPGTPIDTIPFTISEPGTYFLTRNLHHGGTGSAIILSASDVTLDGRGFVITGTPSAPIQDVSVGVNPLGNIIY